jgi:Tol biopolymer transport system component
MKRSMSRTISLSIASAISALSLASAQSGWTARVSLGSGGAQPNDDCGPPAMSSDARYVAFRSFASNVVPGDANGFSDVFVRDRFSGAMELVSVSTGGQQGNQGCDTPIAISGDGRHVAFASAASNLAAGDTNNDMDVFVRDRVAGTTTRASVSSTGIQANADCRFPSISADGRYVAFISTASTLVPGDSNFFYDVFVHDMVTGATVRASVGSAGEQSNGNSFGPVLSTDGRFLGFTSLATNLAPADFNNSRDAFVHDMVTGETKRVSVDSSGNEGNSDSVFTSFSADARFVAFHGGASNLVPGDTNVSWDVFVRDLLTGITTRVSVDSSGNQGDSSSINGVLSADARYVAFSSNATNFVRGDTNVWLDVFVHDRQTGVTERASVSSSGSQSDNWSDTPVLSSDGRFVVFASAATNLVPGDTNGFTDIYARDRHPSGFSSVCDPGQAGVIACPCSNAPSGPERGCDNSSATGGASISASGTAYLGMDELVFTTSGEKPTATSVLLQGGSSIPSGAVFGQGVLCAGAPLKRMYTKQASAGSITAPNLAQGDPSVSTRSAALGDPIQAGTSRWYLVYYRDPLVLAGCPASSTFNATQTGRVTWMP